MGTTASAIPRLRTARLDLRPFSPHDAWSVRELAGAPEVAATTLNIPHPYPEGAAEAWIGAHAGNAERGEVYTWAVTLALEGTLVGAISLHVAKAHGRGELGYWLGSPYWGRGYMTEATRRVVAWGFGDLGLHRVQAKCLPRNVASSRVMEKAGLRFEGLMRGYVRKGDAFEDIAIYGVVRDDLGAEAR